MWVQVPHPLLMVNEINKYGKFSKKKTTGDKSFSKKINFYRNTSELPAEIDAKDYQKFSKKNKSRLGFRKNGWYNGDRYDSKWEAKYAAELDRKVQLGFILSWEKQVTIELNVKIINGMPVLTDEKGIDLKKMGIKFHHICNYRIDFVVTNLDGTKEYIEIKGYRTELWILKFRLTEILFNVVHPEIKLTVVN